MRASDSIFRKPPSEKGRFLKQNSLVDIAMFGERVVGIKVPIKMDLKVKAPPAIRGNTVQGGTKRVTLETGVVVNAPLRRRGRHRPHQHGDGRWNA